jgi:5-methylcytosine-specific restriction endonuclease McrA
MGYPNLYEFAMKELGCSSGAAHRRISAMRLLTTVPEVAPNLESGELGLENASQAQTFFRKEDLRRKEHGENRLTLEEKKEVVSELFGKSTREGQRVLMERSPDVMTPSEKLRPLPEQRTLVQFVADAELMEMLEELKHLLAHQNFEGRMDVLIKKTASIALKRLKPEQKPAPSNAQQVSEGAPTKEIRITSAPWLRKRSRYIPTQERRRVLQRDQNGCTYRDPKSGRVCGSKYGLQFDHLTPFSRGGSHNAQNLTLRCGAHNRYQAERMGLMSSKSPKSMR